MITLAVLPEVMAAGRFRADLYHRLAVVVLVLPPLRERGEDLLVLAQAYLQQYSAAHGVPPKRLSAAAEAWLRQYDWPGNVRELMHVMDRVTLLHVGEEVDAATLAQLCAPVMASLSDNQTAGPSQPLEPASPEPGEAEQIRRALAQSGGNVARAARLLGVSRDTVRYRMQGYGISRRRSAAAPAPEAAEPETSVALQMPTVEPPTGMTSPLDAPEAPSSEDQALPPVALPPPAAERRYLTVLFCDLVDATALAVRLDPEDFREVVRAYHQTCAAVIQRFDGAVDQYLGDGILAYFGHPLAHEDDAQRAVRAGLGILDGLEALNTQLALPAGERLAVRLGVHTGLVVVGAVGEGDRQELLAPGVTVFLAGQLQHLAAPNTLVVSAATYRLIEGYFRCEALGAQSLKGMSQPLPVYRVLGASEVQSRLEVAAARGLTPLVGRSEEVALLVERWGRVTAGSCSRIAPV